MKDWKFQLDEAVVINQTATGIRGNIGAIGYIYELLTTGNYDYVVSLDGGGGKVKVKEGELNKLPPEAYSLHQSIKKSKKAIHIPTNKIVEVVGADLAYMQAGIEHEDKTVEVVRIDTLKEIVEESDSVEEYKFKVGDKVITRTQDGWNGKEGVIFDIEKSTNGLDYRVSFGIKKLRFRGEELELVEESVKSDDECKFEKIATELGKFTDSKNKQYGSSVDATYEMMKVLMEKYAYDKEQYLIPKSLVKHMLLQVRMMDKQNRIFNNPSGEGDSESPYKDLVGYSLIGVDMVESNTR